MRLSVIDSEFLVFSSFWGLELPLHPVTVSPTQRNDPIRYELMSALSLKFLADPLTLAGSRVSTHFKEYILEEPRPYQPGYSSVKDNFDYGRGLYTLLSGSFKGASQRVKDSNEQLCTHARFLGTYDYVPLDLEAFSSSDLESSIWGVVYPCLSTDPFGRVSLGDRLDVHNLDVEVAYHPHANARYYLWEVLDAYREKLDSAGEYTVGTEFAVDGYKLNVTLKSVSYKFTGDTMTIKYTTRLRRRDLFFDNVVSELMRDSEITLRRVESTVLIADSEYSTPPLDKLAWTYASKHYGYQDLGYDFPLWRDLNGVTMMDDGMDDQCCVISNLADNAITVDDVNDAASDVHRAYETFCRKVQDAHGDITAGNFYSTSNALHEWLDVIDANLLEALAELGGIASLLPSVAGLARVYRNAKNLDLLSLGASILDVASDLKLWWDFGVKPDLRVVQEFVEKHDDLFSRMPDLTGSRILYGDFDYSTEDWYIAYRSKIRIRLDGSLLLQAITGLNAVGLLPSPGQLWDAVPFSFVVDWFFNIGGKLKAVDTQGMLLVLPSDVGTHSYKVETKDLPLDLSLYGFQPRASEYPQLRYYYRGVSVVLPSLRESAYDFTPPSPPPWDTGLAFIYKIMKW